MYRLWIEWDFGQDDQIFRSREDARNWFERYVDLDTLGDFKTHQEIFDEGLANIEALRIWNPEDDNL